MDGSPEQFVVKLAPWNARKRMLLNEASICNCFMGNCVPQVYGFFDCDRAYVLVMQCVGCALGSVEELIVEQRPVIQLYFG
jgi:hypothetical protein